LTTPAGMIPRIPSQIILYTCIHLIANLFSFYLNVGTGKE